METETIALEGRITSAPTPLDRKERLKRFGEAMDVVRERVEAKVGAENIAHVRRVDRFSRTMEVVGRVLIYISVEPLAFSLGVGALRPARRDPRSSICAAEILRSPCASCARSACSCARLELKCSGSSGS